MQSIQSLNDYFDQFTARYGSKYLIGSVEPSELRNNGAIKTHAFNRIYDKVSTLAAPFDSSKKVDDFIKSQESRLNWKSPYTNLQLAVGSKALKLKTLLDEKQGAYQKRKEDPTLKSIKKLVTAWVNSINWNYEKVGDSPESTIGGAIASTAARIYANQKAQPKVAPLTKEELDGFFQSESTLTTGAKMKFGALCAASLYLGFYFNSGLLTGGLLGAGSIYLSQQNVESRAQEIKACEAPLIEEERVDMSSLQDLLQTNVVITSGLDTDKIKAIAAKINDLINPPAEESEEEEILIRNNSKKKQKPPQKIKEEQAPQMDARQYLLLWGINKLPTRPKTRLTTANRLTIAKIYIKDLIELIPVKNMMKKDSTLMKMIDLICQEADGFTPGKKESGQRRKEELQQYCQAQLIASLPLIDRTPKKVQTMLRSSFEKVLDKTALIEEGLNVMIEGYLDTKKATWLANQCNEMAVQAQSRIENFQNSLALGDMKDALIQTIYGEDVKETYADQIKTRIDNFCALPLVDFENHMKAKIEELLNEKTSKLLENDNLIQNKGELIDESSDAAKEILNSAITRRIKTDVDSLFPPKSWHLFARKPRPSPLECNGVEVQPLSIAFDANMDIPPYMGALIEQEIIDHPFNIRSNRFDANFVSIEDLFKEQLQKISLSEEELIEVIALAAGKVIQDFYSDGLVENKFIEMITKTLAGDIVPKEEKRSSSLVSRGRSHSTYSSQSHSRSVSP